MPRPIQATIHTEALRQNLQRVHAAAPDAKVWAVVKANAYGHGIERVFEGLRGADGFALLDLDEAQRVRSSFVRDMPDGEYTVAVTSGPRISALTSRPSSRTISTYCCRRGRTSSAPPTPCGRGPK